MISTSRRRTRRARPPTSSVRRRRDPLDGVAALGEGEERPRPARRARRSPATRTRSTVDRRLVERRPPAGSSSATTTSMVGRRCPARSVVGVDDRADRGAPCRRRSRAVGQLDVDRRRPARPAPAWPASRSTVTTCSVPVTVDDRRRRPGLVADVAVVVGDPDRRRRRTRRRPARRRRSRSRPSASCHRFTAAVGGAGRTSSSTVSVAASAKPRATRFSSSWRTSAPSSTPVAERRATAAGRRTAAPARAPSTSPQRARPGRRPCPRPAAR